jgi:hypothetical protein
MRLASTADDSVPVARVLLVHLDGQPACVADITAAQLATAGFSDVVTLCELQRDGPATFALVSRGQADFVVQSVRFDWRASGSR